jgi:hypothetical protein
LHCTKLGGGKRCATHAASRGSARERGVSGQVGGGRRSEQDPDAMHDAGAALRRPRHLRVWNRAAAGERRERRRGALGLALDRLVHRLGEEQVRDRVDIVIERGEHRRDRGVMGPRDERQGRRPRQGREVEPGERGSDGQAVGDVARRDALPLQLLRDRGIAPERKRRTERRDVLVELAVMQRPFETEAEDRAQGLPLANAVEQLKCATDPDRRQLDRGLIAQRAGPG